MTIPDPGAFIASCSAQTSGTYLGSDGYCVLDQANRVIMLLNIYSEQDSYTSETAIFFTMTNPKDNFQPDFSSMSEDEVWKWKRDASFFIRTVTFDLAGSAFSSVITSGYDPN